MLLLKTIIKYVLILLASSAVNCFEKLKVSTEDENCKLRMIAEFFGNNTPVNIIFENNDEVNYLKAIENPYILVKAENIGQLPSTVSSNYIVHANDQYLERILTNLYQQKKKNVGGMFLIITKETNANVTTIFQVLWKFHIVHVSLFTDNKNPYVYTYEPLTSDSKCGINPKITSMEACTKHLLLKNYKSVTNLHYCPLYYLIPDTLNMPINDALLNRRTLMLIGDSLNATIETINSKANSKALNTKDLVFSSTTNYTTQSIILFDIIEGIDSDTFIFVMPKSEPTIRNKIILIFNKRLWISILITFVVVFLFWYFFGKLNRKDTTKGFFGSFLIIVQLTFAMRLYRLPKSNIFRAILIIYVLYAVIMRRLFQEKIVKALTYPTYENGITDLQDLANSKLRIASEFHYSKIFPDIHNPLQARFIERWYYNRNINIFDLLMYKNFSIITTTKHIPSHYLSNIEIINDRINTHDINLVLILKKGHFLTSSIKKIITQMKEAGLYTARRTDSMYENYMITWGYYNMRFSLYHLRFAFIILITGLVLAVVIFLGEKILQSWFYWRASHT